MKRWAMIGAAWGMAIGIAAMARAEEAKTKEAYLEQLQVKLEHAARRANQPTSTGSSVVGLRGSKQEPMSKQLYWKGKKATKAVSVEEVQLFRTAIEQAKAGQVPEALVSLSSFEEKFPTSAMLDDVKETKQRLSAN